MPKYQMGYGVDLVDACGEFVGHACQSCAKGVVADVVADNATLPELERFEVRPASEPAECFRCGRRPLKPSRAVAGIEDSE